MLDQYQRYYCHQCQHYAPEGYGAHGAKKCPSCGGVLSYVAQYDRFYCYRCNAYASVETPAPASPEPVVAAEAAAKAEPAREAKPVDATPPTAAAPADTVSATPSSRPAPQPEPQPTAAPGPLETAPSPAPTVAPEPVTVKPAEAAAEEPLEAPPAAPNVKPAVLRVKVFTMRKAELMDLCKAYDLDPLGTKEQIQERLLSYLNDLEEEEKPEAEEEAPAPAPAPVAEAPKEEKAEAPAAPVAAAPEATAVEVQVEKAPEPASQAASGYPSQAVLVEEAPAKAAASEMIPFVVTPEPVAAPKVEHPCATCGRELSYIAQYGRWYCYWDQKYAPATRARNACPTCGQTLRWIDLYQRWWCDSCRKYAPADLPKPSGAAAVIVQPMVREVATPVATEAISQPTASAHRHSHPSAGIGLVAFGLVLFILEELLVEFPAVFPMPFGIMLPAQAVVAIRFLAFFFVALGAIAGLMALRERA